MKRLQTDIPDGSFEKLKSLKKRTDASSYAEVVNKAFKLYDFCMNATEEGKEIKIVSSDGKEVLVKLI